MKKIIEIHVKPGKKKFEVLGFNAWTGCLEIKTKEKAEKNKANQELEKSLTKLFKTKTKIIQGKKSKTKKILIENTKEITKLIE